MERYACNRNSLTEQDQEKLADRRVLVVGCGGLGGYVTELLARVGVGRLTIVDGDVFEESNLNRQLFCTTETIGKSKAAAAKERIFAVNPLVTCEAISEFLTGENADRILEGHDIVVDALDNADTRALLLEAAARAGIPMVHGAIAGFQGRVSVIYPGDAASALLSGGHSRGIEQETGNLCFTASCVASIQAAEAVKCLLSKGQLLRNRTIEVDLLSDVFETISFS